MTPTGIRCTSTAKIPSPMASAAKRERISTKSTARLIGIHFFIVLPSFEERAPIAGLLFFGQDRVPWGFLHVPSLLLQPSGALIEKGLFRNLLGIFH
jgi:hypothetical protein